MEESDYDYNLDSSQIVHLDQVKKMAEEGNHQILDARNAKDWENGHIPSSSSMPFSKMFNADHTIKSKEERIKLFEEAGINLDKPIISSCMSGVTSTVLIYALRDISKSGKLFNYDGSWSEFRRTL